MLESQKKANRKWLAENYEAITIRECLELAYHCDSVGF